MKILLVDERPENARRLARMITSWDHGLHVESAAMGDEASRAIERQEFDAIVADVRRCSAKSEWVASEIRRQDIGSRMVVLAAEESGQAKKQEARRQGNETNNSDVVCPQVLSGWRFQPAACVRELTPLLRRACVLQRLFERPQFQSFVGKLTGMPSTASLYNELLNELESPQGTIARVGEIIARDSVLAAKVVHLANSAVCGQRRRVESAAKAAALLGLEAIKSLLLSGRISSIGMMEQSPLEMLMDHSLRVALMARAIAHHEDAGDQQFNEVFTAGLLHDLGKMVLLKAASEEYQLSCELSKQERISQCEAEARVIGASHDMLGAHLLAAWGLPSAIVDVAAEHHRLIPGDGFSSLAAVVAANLASHATGPPDRDESLRTALEQQGMCGRFERWRNLGLLNLSKE